MVFNRKKSKQGAISNKVRTFLNDRGLSFREENIFKEILLPTQFDLTVFRFDGDYASMILCTHPFSKFDIEMDYFNFFLATDDYVDWIRDQSPAFASLKNFFEQKTHSPSLNITTYDLLPKKVLLNSEDRTFYFASEIPDYADRLNKFSEEPYVLHVRSFFTSDKLGEVYDSLPSFDKEYIDNI